MPHLNPLKIGWSPQISKYAPANAVEHFLAILA
jgi:hypothetical protein